MIEVSAIYRRTWGYDATYNSYYQVTRLTAKGAWVREIRKRIESCSGLDGMEMSIPNEFKTEEMFFKLKPSGAYIKDEYLRGRGVNIYKWDEKPNHFIVR